MTAPNAAARLIRIERAQADDEAQVLALLDRCQLPDAGLHEHFGHALVARADHAVVGCVALELYPGAALLRSLAVQSACRDRDIGRRLTQAALELAREKGAARVYLLTETAVGFFARFGFVVIDRAAVDSAVQQSVEFVSACPASTPVMVLDL